MFWEGHGFQPCRWDPHTMRAEAPEVRFLELAERNLGNARFSVGSELALRFDWNFFARRVVRVHILVENSYELFDDVVALQSSE